jgi:hypothetical protein
VTVSAGRFREEKDMKKRQLGGWWVRMWMVALVAASVGAPASASELELRLSAERGQWRLGERIDLRVALANVSGSSLEVEAPDVANGSLRVFVAPDRGAFREYRGPHWGLEEGSRAVPLRPGEESSTTAVLLWNHRVPTEHLTALYADRIRQERIDEEIAIVEPGRYWLKAVYTGNRERVESQPMPLDVLAPEPVDAPIWDHMRRDGKLAYLLHTGGLPWPARSAEAQAFMADVRQLMAANPGSSLAVKIERLLACFEQPRTN